MDVKNIPVEIQKCKHWITHKSKKPNVPKGADYLKNPDVWHTFSECLAEVKANPGYGLGFVLTDSGYTCVDIDHISQHKAAAEKIAKRLNSYTEISPSGDGLHIWLKDTHTRKEQRFTVNLGGVGIPVEVYSAARYMTVTGNRVKDFPADIRENTAGLDWLYSLKVAKKVAKKGCSFGKVAKLPKAELPVYSDDDVIAFGLQVYGQKFQDLFHDSGESADGVKEGWSQSEHDQSLMDLLCFLTGANKEQMERLFLASACAFTRDRKNDLAHYLELTTTTALKGWEGKYYSPDYGRFPYMTAATEKKPAKPMKDIQENVQFLIEREGRFLRYNMLLDTVEVWRRAYVNNRIQWVEDPRYKNRFELFLTAVSNQANKSGIGLKSRSLRNEYIQAISRSSEYNPLQEYLKSLTWNGEDVISKVCECITIPTDYIEFRPLFQIFFKKWLIQAVALAFNSLDKLVAADFILILQGPQGVGKTRFVNWLAPCPDWVLIGGAIDPKNKDDMVKSEQYFIVELGEIGLTLNAKNNDALKNYLTQPFDQYRKVYGTEQTKRVRYQSFMGTVNDERFLTDTTGNRRYLVVPVTHIDITALQNLDKNQLWAQAMYLKETESFHLTAAEQAARDSLNDTAFTQKSNEELVLLDSYDWSDDGFPKSWKKRTATEIAEDIYGESGARMSRRVARGIRQLAKRDKRIKIPTRHGSRKEYFFPARLLKYDPKPEESISEDD